MCDQDAAGGEFARHTGGPFRVRRAYVGDEAEPVSLAISMASASVLYVSIDRTGPKISSFAIRISR